MGLQSIQAASRVSTLDSKPRLHWGPGPIKCPVYLVGEGQPSPLSSCSSGHSSHFGSGHLVLVKLTSDIRQTHTTQTSGPNTLGPAGGWS